MWYGEWPGELERPSPLPWRVKRTIVPTIGGGREVEWVVIAADGRSIGSFSRSVDAWAACGGVDEPDTEPGK